MKKLMLVAAFVALAVPGFSDDMKNYKTDTEAVWRTGAGAEDGTFTAISTSMLGWGLALSVGIAILASVLHQSTAGHAHVDCD